MDLRRDRNEATRATVGFDVLSCFVYSVFERMIEKGEGKRGTDVWGLKSSPVDQPQRAKKNLCQTDQDYGRRSRV